MDKKDSNKKKDKAIKFVHKIGYANDEVVEITHGHMGIVESFIYSLEKSMTKQFYENLFSVNKIASEYISTALKLDSIRSEKAFFVEQISAREKNIKELDSKIKLLNEELVLTKNEVEYNSVKSFADKLESYKTDDELDYMTEIEKSEKFKASTAKNESRLEKKEEKNTSRSDAKIKKIDSKIQKSTSTKSAIDFMENKKDDIYKTFMANAKTTSKSFNEKLDDMFDILWQLAKDELKYQMAIVVIMKPIIEYHKGQEQLYEKNKFNDEYFSKEHNVQFYSKLGNALKKARQSKNNLENVRDENLFEDVFNTNNHLDD